MNNSEEGEYNEEDGEEEYDDDGNNDEEVTEDIDEENDQEDEDDIEKTEDVNHEPSAVIEGGDTVTYITPQSVIYIYNKNSGTTYEYEESLENKEDNLREVKLDGENTFQVKMGDIFETISDANIKEYYKFITKNKDITKYFFRDMLYASTAVLKDIKESFSIK